MINCDDVVQESIKKNNPNSPHVPNHPYITLIIEGSGFGKKNSLFNLINQQRNIDEI